MIVIGYQGIGKSTISHASKGNFIDLESGNFWVDGKRDPEWFKPYCQIALHLHKQGYVVFTSSHEVTSMRSPEKMRHSFMFVILHLISKMIGSQSFNFDIIGQVRTRTTKP